MPNLSVVMPFRDAAATIEAATRSVVRQRGADWELVAVDDGSIDGSRARLRRAAAGDRRVRLVEPGRVGLVGALNAGLAAARAPLIARFDADDLMHPDRLRLQERFLTDHPEIDVVGSRVRLFPCHRIRAGNREYLRWQNGCITPEQIAADLYVESPFAHPSVTLRRATIEAAGGYAEGAFPEDYELWLRLHHAGCRMAKLEQVLLAWRESPGRASRMDDRYAREAFDRLRARFLARDARVREAAEVVVWGAGRRTRRRAALLRAEGVEPSGWVDIDPRKIGRELDGLRVRPPEWLDRQPRPLVLVYVTTHGARDLIADRLAGWGYRPGTGFLSVG